MPKLKFYLQFFLILLIFIFPPLAASFFTGNAGTIYFGRFSIWTAICFAAAIYLFLQEKHSTLKTEAKSQIARFLNIAEFLKTFGLLCATAAVFQAIGFILKMDSATDIVLPKRPVEFLACGATLIIAAFFEEVLYRGYLPFAIKRFAKPSFIAETVAILLFTFAHAYGGILAILNALLAGIVLRRCAIKTNGIWAGFAAHLIYNLITLIALR